MDGARVRPRRRELGPVPRRALLLAWRAARPGSSALPATVDRRIGAFHGAVQTTCVEEFVAADSAHIERGAERVKRAVAEAACRALNDHPDQEAILQRNARLRRRQASIRDLMQQVPDVLLALRPCWVMSPLVVAQLLPGGRPFFDVVVFDEASQIRPADAISSLARARQVIVVGDSKQLPPTTLFDVTTTIQDAEPVEDVPTSFTEDMESILDAFRKRGKPDRPHLLAVTPRTEPTGTGTEHLYAAHCEQRAACRRAGRPGG